MMHRSRRAKFFRSAGADEAACGASGNNRLRGNCPVWIFFVRRFCGVASVAAELCDAVPRGCAARRWFAALAFARNAGRSLSRVLWAQLTVCATWG